MSTAGLLATYAEQVGLSQDLAAFPAADDRGCEDGSLSSRLAKNPFLMAPMAGVTNPAYRLMMRAGGAALAYTEMVSVAGIHYGGEKTWALVDPDPTEPDVAVQLFGAKPELFSEAVEAVCARLGDRLALIDINMACPVPKVTKKGEGSALLDNPQLAAEIVRVCVSRAKVEREGWSRVVPITVKLRSGRVPSRIVAPEFAKAMADAGAAAVAVHGRTASQLYHDEADWKIIHDVVNAVDVPVIGSGDVRTSADAVRMLQETGVAATFVARGSYGYPWVFSEARALLEGRTIDPVRDPQTRLDAFELHVRLLEETGAHIACARTLAGWYLRGLPHATDWRNRAVRCSTAEEFVLLAEEAKAYGQDVG